MSDKCFMWWLKHCYDEKCWIRKWKQLLGKSKTTSFTWKLQLPIFQTGAGVSQSKYNASWLRVSEVCVILLVAFVSKWPIWDGASAGLGCFRGAFLSQCIFYNPSSELIRGIIYLNWPGNPYEAPKGFHKCRKVLFILVSPDLKEREKGYMARWMDGHLDQ